MKLAPALTVTGTMLTGWLLRWKIEFVQNSIAGLELLDTELKCIWSPSSLTILAQSRPTAFLNLYLNYKCCTRCCGMFRDILYQSLMHNVLQKMFDRVYNYF